MELSDILSAIRSDKSEPSLHARREAQADGLTIPEVRRATLRGEIIEDYPNDFPHPSCLILGYLDNGDPVHAVWAYNRRSEEAILVTVYLPNPELWILWRFRRERS